MLSQEILTSSDHARLEESRSALKSGHYAHGLTLARSVRHAAYKKDDEALYADACVIEAAHLARAGLEEQACQLAEQILPTVDRLCELRTSVEIRNILSRCYVNLGEPAKALPFALESLKRTQLIGDDVLTAWAYCRLGSTYGSLQYLERCVQSLEKAIEYAEKTTDSEVRFGCYQNLANNLRWEIDFRVQLQPIETIGALTDKTIAVLKKAIEYSDGQASREIYVYRTMVGLYSALKDATNLSNVLQKYEAVNRQLNNPLHDLTTKIARGHLMLLEGKATLAARFVEQELTPLQQTVGDAMTEQDLHALKYQVFKCLGDYSKALLALEKIRQEDLIRRIDLMREQSQLLLGEIEIVDAKHEAKSWREQSEKSAMQFERERLAARHDPLTLLMNRRAFDEDVTKVLQELAGHCKGYKALALVDVDHFKSINDQFGHEIGDQVLFRIGQGLKESIRSVDTVYRHGGEEFVILLSLENASDLLEFCERTRQFIATMNWVEQLGTDNKLTVSVGATPIKLGDTAKAVVVRADRAMYQAKNEGRNLTRLVNVN